MTSKLRPLVLLASFTSLFVISTHLHAQPPATPLTPQVALSPAEKKFDAAAQALEKYLYDAGAFVVDITSDWTFDGGGKTTKGTNLFHIAVQKVGKYRIEAGSVRGGKAGYICVSDGQTVTRFHRAAKYYSQQKVSADHSDLQDDVLTQMVLADSGAELLLMEQIRAEMIGQISGFRSAGNETVDGQEAIHIQLTMRDGRLLDLWFANQGPPLLLKLVSTKQIRIGQQQAGQTGQTALLVTDSKFKWKVGGPLPKSTFTVTLPPDAKRVDDVLRALRGTDPRELLGKPAPPLELKDLAGNQVRLSDYLGKKVVVLIFWASWCAPSINDMDTLNEYIALCEKNGAVVLAVNFGEPIAQVKASVQKLQFQGTVLVDPQTKGLEAYRIGSLPTTILIGKDGTVQSFHTGSTPETRQKIRADTAALLKGQKLTAAGQ